MALPQAKTLSDVQRVIAEAIRQASNDALTAADASRCAASVVVRLKESGVRLVKRRDV